MDLAEFKLINCCKVGLLHQSTGRFLTIEVFNNDLNISSTALKQRQVWSMLSTKEAQTTDSGGIVVHWLSPLGRLLSADKDGNVTCSAECPGPDERFVVEWNPNGEGTISIKSAAHGYYFTGNDTGVQCFSKTVKWWAMRLAMHPQINIRNLFRGRYVRLTPTGDEIRADLAHPWGCEALLRLVQLPLSGSITSPAIPPNRVHLYGQVAIATESGLYLQPDGSLSDTMDDAAMFSIEIKPGSPTLFSFKHVKTGAYLSAIGPGTLKTKANQTNKGKEECFVIERGAFQVSVLAFNDKFISMKQGMEILANQRELNETELFQLEYTGGGRGFDCTQLLQTALTANKESFDEAGLSGNGLLTNCKDVGHECTRNGLETNEVYSLMTGAWRLRSKENKLWKLRFNAPVHHTGNDGEPETEFDMYALKESEGRPGALVLQACQSQQVVAAKKLGAVSCSSNSVGRGDGVPQKEELFCIYPLVNRTSIIIQSALTGGFLSRNTAQNKGGSKTDVMLDCCGPAYEEFKIRRMDSGTCQIYANAKGNASNLLQWAISEVGLYMRPSEVAADTPLEELSTPAEPGTEFVFYFLGNGRVLIRPVNSPVVAHQNAFCLVYGEMKGDVKISNTGEIKASCVWEL